MRSVTVQAYVEILENHPELLGKGISIESFADSIDPKTKNEKVLQEALNRLIDYLEISLNAEQMVTAILVTERIHNKYIEAHSLPDSCLNLVKKIIGF